MTEAEKLFWSRVRNNALGFKIRRQVPLDAYVADFACYELKLVIEIDGSQHAINAGKDAARTAYLEKHGYTVIRFWNHEVLGNIDGVLQNLQQRMTALEADT